MKRFVIFCDFDGTVSKQDVGYQMFHHYSGGRNDELLPGWKSGELSTRDCLRMEAGMVQASAEEILSFLDQFEIDDSFVQFERLCRESAVPVVIVSEGMDFYIRHILKSYHLAHLPVICNHGSLVDGGISVEFPHHNRTCKSCGSCKAERMAEYRQGAGTDCCIAFVGDGYSDACAAREADILFAKKDLERYCQSENIAYNAFVDFRDVARQLIQMSHLTGRL